MNLPRAKITVAKSGRLVITNLDTVHKWHLFILLSPESHAGPLYNKQRNLLAYNAQEETDNSAF